VKQFVAASGHHFPAGDRFPALFDLIFFALFVPSWDEDIVIQNCDAISCQYAKAQAATEK
jgi:hypothetical protein